MSATDPPEPAFATLAIPTGHRRSEEQEHSEPIYATSSYVFRNAAEAAARFSGDLPGNIYSRFTNPTVRAFEERLALPQPGVRPCDDCAGPCLDACPVGALGSKDFLYTQRVWYLKTTDNVCPGCSFDSRAFASRRNS